MYNVLLNISSELLTIKSMMKVNRKLATEQHQHETINEGNNCKYLVELFFCFSLTTPICYLSCHFKVWGPLNFKYTLMVLRRGPSKYVHILIDIRVSNCNIRMAEPFYNFPHDQLRVGSRLGTISLGCTISK